MSEPDSRVNEDAAFALPDVLGWPLDQARTMLEAMPVVTAAECSLRIVETAPLQRTHKPERSKRAKSQTSSAPRPAPILGQWRVVRCRVLQSTLDGANASPIIEITTAREIVACEIVACEIVACEIGTPDASGCEI